ncbi:hypothetical protein KY314_01660 [Candidatus Woesearchaeota archaeon]|nr:hypothetical protein [Candidatus Woesearchaeota archaeon]
MKFIKIIKNERFDEDLAIVKYNKEEKKEYQLKNYGCLFKMKGDEGWNDFGGSVGYTIAHFDTLKEAKKFIERGLREQEKNPEIWLEMVEA